MMIGPMKKKVITAVFVTAIVLIAIFGAISAVFLINNDKHISQLEERGEVVQRYVFTKDLLAGDIVTAEDVKYVDVKGESAPLDSYEYKEEKKMIGGKETLVKIDRKGEIIGRRLKINANERMIVTESLFYDYDDEPTIDTRMQEYNMITLPSNLVEGDYIDVRLRFATGEDYTVIVGKKIEAIGATGEQSNTIFLRLNEEELIRMSSAIIESYLDDGAYLYANRYIDPSNQLFSYNYEDLVTKYKNEKVVTLTETVYSGEEILHAGEEITRTNEELASIMGVSVEDVENIAEAIEAKDEETLQYYSNKLVKRETKLASTYPVKLEVANLIRNNPNILEEIRNKYNVEELMSERETMLQFELTKVDPYTGEITTNSEVTGKVKAGLDKEIETQRLERQEYLRGLLK